MNIAVIFAGGIGWQECFECNEILDYTIDIVKARMMMR